MARKYEWIMYISQNIPGYQTFDLYRVHSISEAKRTHEDYSREVCGECTSTLYAYSDEAWAEAEDFRNVGCPFDYPDRMIESGARGGVKVTRT